MGRTIRTQVALYLDDEIIEALNAEAERTGLTKQYLMRAAIGLMLEKYEWRYEPGQTKAESGWRLVRAQPRSR